MIVLLEDNGTYLSSVNAPYDPLRAKATPYQTGVRAPMVVAGPMVRAPGRTATKMVSAVDLFELFGEIAGLDVRSLVPASHILDSQPLLPYLTNPGQSSFRRYNFTQLGSGVKPPSVQTWPSVFTVADQKSATTSSSTLNSFAPPTAANGLALALQSSTRRVATFVSNVYPNLIIQPSQTWAVRNDRYKLVKSHRARCDADENPYEFYDLQPTPDNPVGLDAALNNLLNPPRDLTREQRQNLAELHVALNAILNSEPACYGDGNLDKVVNQEDFVGVHRFWNQPSVFDFNNDGVTDQEDLDCVLQNFGNDYLSSGPGESCP